LSDVASRRTPLSHPRLNITLSHDSSIMYDEPAVAHPLLVTLPLEHDIEFVQEDFVGELLSLDQSIAPAEVRVQHHSERPDGEPRIRRLKFAHKVIGGF